MLLSYAREILRLNDDAAAFFSRAKYSGSLRVGLPSDYAVAFLQGVITEYARQHPDIALEIHCGLSSSILERMRADDLDLVIAMVDAERTQYLSRSWIERPIWAGAEDAHVELDCRTAHRRAPRRLHLPRPNDPRARRRPHPLADRLHEPGHLRPAERRRQRPRGQRPDPPHAASRHARPRPDDGLPPLEDIRVGLFYKHPRLNSAGIGLINHIIATT